MQGRLSPPSAGKFQCFPRDEWRDELPRAAEAGLDCIEWIYDLYGADVNPLGTVAGEREMAELSAAHRIRIRSVCADYFMDCPLLRVDTVARDERMERLKWLLDACARLSIGRIVLPFVDASRIVDEAERRVVAELLLELVPRARRLAVELHLETDLGPAEFASLTQGLPADVVKVNYDSGNSASLGYDPVTEFTAYGRRVGSVHIKDRVRGGGTVPLGTGSCDLEAVFDGLRAFDYRGDFVLQVARGATGEEVPWIKGVAEHVRDSWRRRGGTWISA